MINQITEFDQIENKFDEIDQQLNKPINIYLIGGAVLLYYKLKPSTKDIDIVVTNEKDKELLLNIFNKLNFSHETPNEKYTKMNLEIILIKENYRFDIFNTTVCGKLFLSKNMIQRSNLIKKYKHISLFTCSIEDIFIFKSITERDGDIQDCYNLAKHKLNWNIILSEIQYQIKQSKQEVWITWFAERLNILNDKKIVIPILKTINKLSKNYYKQIDKELK